VSAAFSEDGRPMQSRLSNEPRDSLTVLICEVGEHLGRMAARADRLVGFDDSALLIDQVTDTFRESGLGIVTRAVSEADRAIGVAE
jgi:hypothetical protein